MTKQVQLRRGTSAEHDTFTGAIGETTVDTDKDTLVVHDGSTVGGFPLQREDLYVGAYKNKLINADFSLWQRGISFPHASTTNLYTADRWRTEGNTFSGAVSRQAFGAGQTDVPGEPSYFLRWDVTANPALSIELSQRMEDVRTLAGETATVSFYAKAGATLAAGALNLRVHQAPNGSGGGTVTVPLGQITTSWQRVSVTVSVPSLSGAVIGAASYLTVSIESPSAHSSAFLLDLAQAQVELGPFATRFERRPIAIELVLAQRYYQKSYARADAPGTATSTNAEHRHADKANSTQLSTWASFLAELRVAPSMTLYNPNSGASGSLRDFTGGVDINASFPTVGTKGALMSVDAAGLAVGDDYRFHWIADAEL